MIHRTFMTMDNSKAEKRNYVASESEGPEGEEDRKLRPGRFADGGVPAAPIGRRDRETRVSEAE